MNREDFVTKHTAELDAAAAEFGDRPGVIRLPINGGPYDGVKLAIRAADLLRTIRTGRYMYIPCMPDDSIGAAYAVRGREIRKLRTVFIGYAEPREIMHAD